MSKVQVHDWAQLFKRDPFLADVLDQAQWGPRLYHAIRACGAYYQDQLDCMEAYNLEEGPCKAEINAMQQCTLPFNPAPDLGCALAHISLKPELKVDS